LVLIFFRFFFPRWRREFWDEFLDALGVGVTFLGFLVRIIARGQKAEKSPHGENLVTTGIYEALRHPMYFGTLLIGLGVTLILFKWWVFLIFLFIFFAIYIPQINREEKKLLKRFKLKYKDYCQTTPKYFPHLFKIKKFKSLSVKWPWIKKELPSLAITLFLVFCVELWQDVRLFGLKELGKELVELFINLAIFISLSSLTLFKKEK
jgi:protein-S-isoprenylcysteine O-methyltransferase Ste14